MLKPTIISISMATVMAGAAISPALSIIASAFPDASPTLVKLILTIPAFMIIPSTFLSSWLTTQLPKRTIVLIGLVIYMIGGIGPQFMPTIELVLCFRLVLGVGVGLLITLAESLIYDHFVGRERTKMMGYNSAFSNFGGIITMLVAGWLATFGWRAPFNVYFIGLLIFSLAVFFLPKGEKQKAPETEPKAKIPLAVYGYSIGLCGIMLAYYAIPTNIAIYLKNNEFGGPSLAGTVVSLTTVGGMITSLLLVQIEELLVKAVIPAALFVMGIAFLLLALASNVVTIMFAVCIVGLVQGTLFPILMMRALNNVPLHQADLTIAISSAFIFLGQFISPLVLDGLEKIVGTSSIRSQFSFLALGALVMAIISAGYIIKSNWEEKHQQLLIKQ